MNDTRFKSPPHRHGRWAGSVKAAAALAVVLGAASLWVLNWGCADPRTEPLTPAQPGYTETINLWNNTPTDANGLVAANFTVAEPLASIAVPGVDTPARLTVAAYIVPDCQIYRRLQILNDSIPFITDSTIIPTLVVLTANKTQVDSLHTHAVDSLEGLLRSLVDSATTVLNLTDSLTQITYRGHAISCDSAVFRMVPANPAHIDSVLSSVGSAFAAFGSSLGLDTLEVKYTRAQLDTARLGFELVYLNALLDNRYTVSVALDSTNTFYYPNAVYVNTAGQLSGQEIYAAQIDTSAGYLGSGFTIPLDRMAAADISHLGHTFEVNWVVCFAGSTQPCLHTGTHTMYVKLPGRNARVTGTIVLVYAGRT